jgi:hypothetical protein
MNQIMFNDDYFKLLKNLSPINPSVIFEKDGDKLVVKRATDSKSTGYKIVAPLDHFTFEPNRLAIKDFSNFYQSIGAFGVSTLYHEANKIIIKNKTNKINYVLSSPEALTKSPVDVGIKDPSVFMNLSQADIAEICKANSLIKARFAGIYFDGKDVTIKLFNNNHQNSVDKVFTPTSIVPGTIAFDFPIYSGLFTHIPSDQDYAFAIKKTGSVCASFTRNDITLDIVSGRVKSLDGDDKGDVL